MQAQRPTQRFAELLTQRLNERVSRFNDRMLDPTLLREVRNSIHELIDGTFKRSSRPLSREAIWWLTDQYFKNATVGTTAPVPVGTMVVINEYRLDQLPLADVILLRDLFNETSLRASLSAEIDARKNDGR